MVIEAVLFDFAGTLLVPVPARDWLRATTDQNDPHLAARLEAAGRPGGPEPEAMPDGLAQDYARRDTFVPSCELGVMKPDPRMFEQAVRRLGVSPDRTLMVGDSPVADGGALALGIRTLLLPYSPPGAPHGLDAVLRLAQISSPST